MQQFHHNLVRSVASPRIYGWICCFLSLT